ncbi:MAG TPA: DUF5985 family protein [Methylomirabilota bacterium]|nr:DUF5985 family protein [Methylomirabilota bacterium]
MANVVYILCALASSVVAWLLLKHYRRTNLRLLFWAGAAFVAFAAGNILLYVDLGVLPRTIDLATIRTAITLVGVALLLYGLIRENT